MGTIRLGRLPKTERWEAVVALLDNAPNDPAAIAAATVEAAEDRLRKLAGDPSLTHCFWLLTQITWAARSPSFEARLQKLGLEIRPGESVLSLVARVSDRVREDNAGVSTGGPFRDLASLALRRALSDTVGQYGGGLFTSSVEDFQRACRAYSRDEAFGSLAHGFFGDFLSRTLRFFVDKELAHHVGPGHRLSSVAESEKFSASLDTYARESARIMRDFASDWYSKHNWQSKGDVSKSEARGFVAHALRKLRGELKREKVA